MRVSALHNSVFPIYTFSDLPSAANSEREKSVVRAQDKISAVKPSALDSYTEQNPLAHYQRITAGVFHQSPAPEKEIVSDHPLQDFGFYCKKPLFD